MDMVEQAKGFNNWLQNNKWKFVEDELFDAFFALHYSDLELEFAEMHGDMDDFPEYAREQFDMLITDLFDDAHDNGKDECTSCEFNEDCTDAFGTGDSPTNSECTNHEPSNCQYVLNNLENYDG